MGLQLMRKDGDASTSVPFSTVGDMVQFKKPNIPKAEPSFTLGIWLGRCTESDAHCVASTGVFKTRSVRRLVPDKPFNGSTTFTFNTGNAMGSKWNQSGD